MLLLWQPLHRMTSELPVRRGVREFLVSLGQLPAHCVENSTIILLNWTFCGRLRIMPQYSRSSLGFSKCRRNFRSRIEGWHFQVWWIYLNVSTRRIHIAQQIWSIDTHRIAGTLHHFCVSSQVQLRMRLCERLRKRKFVLELLKKNTFIIETKHSPNLNCVSVSVSGVRKSKLKISVYKWPAKPAQSPACRPCKYQNFKK